MTAPEKSRKMRCRPTCEPDQKVLVLAGKEDDRRLQPGHAAVPTEPTSSSVFAPEPVNHRHRDHGKQQVGGADRDRLQVPGDLAEAGVGENHIQVIRIAFMPESWLNNPMLTAKKSVMRIPFLEKSFSVAWLCSIPIEATISWRSCS